MMDLFIEPGKMTSLVNDHPTHFPTFVSELEKSGAKWIAKDVFGTKATSATIQAHYGLLGRDAFIIALDTLADKSMPALAKRVDKHNPALKDLSGRECRRHVLGIATGEMSVVAPAARQTSARRGGVAFKSPFTNPSLVPDASTDAARKPRAARGRTSVKSKPT